MMTEITLQNPETKSSQIEVSIVNGYKDSDFENYYNLFDLKKPVDNVKLIGVEDGDDFAIRLRNKDKRKFAFALYLDGVNVSQKSGIKSLTSIEEKDRSVYKKHNVFICNDKGDGNYFFLERYSQKNGENRRFIFTSKEGCGINEILINDPSLINRIEIYIWEEEKYENVAFFNVMPDSYSPQVRVGAGSATNEKFGTSSGLLNPTYIGKAMFVYVNSKELQHLGRTKIAKEFNFKDPMDLVPMP